MQHATLATYALVIKPEGWHGMGTDCLGNERLPPANILYLWPMHRFAVNHFR
jgi:hypothetical protein